jgi:hypothetical protein
LEAYRTALAARNLEINLFWQRSNYFLVLNTAVAVGFFSRTDRDWLALGLSVIGLVISLLWVRLNLGSKFWQTRWERRLEVVERALDPDFGLFSADWRTIRNDVREGLEFRPDQSQLQQLYKRAVMRKPSVSKTMTLLSAFFVLVWFVAAVVSAVEAL